MRTESSNLNNGACFKLADIFMLAYVLFLLQGCCASYCEVFGSGDSCYLEYCESDYEKATKKNNAQKLQDSLAGSNGTAQPPNEVPVSQPGKNKPGEYFKNSLTIGPNLSFKSSDEEYSTYGDNSHQPGLGGQISVGTAFPLSDRWGLAGAIGFKQNNASEKFGYNEPGSSSSSKDVYKYSYIGATILGEYWLTNNLAIAAGPEVDFLVSANLKPASGDKENVKESSVGVGVDAKVGLKYEIPGPHNRRSNWGISLFYDHRISRLNKKEMNGYDVPAYHMKSVQLGLSYFICGKCKPPKMK